jgi:hypothetical protein
LLAITPSTPSSRANFVFPRLLPTPTSRSYSFPRARPAFFHPQVDEISLLTINGTGGAGFDPVWVDGLAVGMGRVLAILSNNWLLLLIHLGQRKEE